MSFDERIQQGAYVTYFIEEDHAKAAEILEGMIPANAQKLERMEFKPDPEADCMRQAVGYVAAKWRLPR